LLLRDRQKLECFRLEAIIFWKLIFFLHSTILTFPGYIFAFGQKLSLEPPKYEVDARSRQDHEWGQVAEDRMLAQQQKRAEQTDSKRRLTCALCSRKPGARFTNF
jgi:hypothetical protein